MSGMADRPVRGMLQRLLRHDLSRRLMRSPGAMVAVALVLLLVVGAIFAPWIATTNPYNAASLDLMNANLSPTWFSGGDPHFLLGTDNQGADLISLMLFGLRTSLLVGVLAVAVSLLLGTLFGLIAGYERGWVDSLIMRIADVQFTFPAILLALLIGGISRMLVPEHQRAGAALLLVVASLGIAHWPHFARLVRGATLVEARKDYVAAARLIGHGRWFIMLQCILPNVLNAVFVLATLDIAFAIMGEATLSFLGFGLPPTQPSLGTLIRAGYDNLFSGQWWVVIFPSLLLVILVMAINAVGDWLRVALNPRLR
jgi:peptide/nickel transport system permease protein